VPAFATVLLATTPDELITKVESRYNRAKTLSVHFIENYSLLGRSRPPESGRLTLRKQGKMRWDYERPAGKLFISDGKTIYLYAATDNRVERVPMKQAEDLRAPLGFLLGRLDLRKEFRNFTVKPGEGGEWLQAEAKNDKAPYSTVEMLVGSNGEIRQLRVEGRDESKLSFTFEGEVLNPPVPESRFQFAIPPGAEVVDTIETQGEAR
jgi:outer membrane lipoprotein carrier protein